MSVSDGVVIVGAGHAGFATADALRQTGYTAPVTLIDAQHSLPYQRPPLSKSYLTDSDTQVQFRPETFYADNDIVYLAGEQCRSIDRRRNVVLTAAGRVVPYRHLVLATGAEPIPLQVPGTDLDGVCRLHTMADAEDLATRLFVSSDVVIIGGGFIGLEVAAAARSREIAVTVVEAMPRLMPRVVSEEVSQHVLAQHRAAGADVRLGARVVAMHGRHGRLEAVELDCGAVIPADLAVVGVGVRPRTELAATAGLAVDNGVIVDEYLRTADPDISAVGDCCAFPDPFTGDRVRLESVQNATDHGRCVADRLAGDPRSYREVPWFWSHQGRIKIQIAGRAVEGASHHVVGHPGEGRFSVLHLDSAGRLLCGESVNSPADHIALRTLVAHREPIAHRLRTQPGPSLKELAKAIRRTTTAGLVAPAVST